MAKPDLTPVLVALGAGYGIAGAFTPRLLARCYGMQPTDETAAALQLFGTRNLALAGLAAAARDDKSRDGVATAVGVACTLDAALAVGNAVRGRSTARTAIQTVATTVGVAALCAYYVKG